MAILNVQTQNVGQAGTYPNFVYIETNNTTAQVESAGFLNGIVSEGVALNDKQMALVSTKLSPSAKESQTNLYQIQYSGGDWTLVSIQDGGTGVFDNLTVNLSTNLKGAFTSTLTGTANLKGPNDLSANLNIFRFGNVDIDATTVAIGSSGTTQLNFGSNASDITITSNPSKNLFITNLPTATTASALFIDGTTGKVTKGTAPTSFSTSTDYTITGSWTIQDDWVFQSQFTVNALGGNVAIQAQVGDMLLECFGLGSTLSILGQDVSVIANNGLGLTSTGSNVTITSNTANVAAIGDKFLATAVTEINLTAPNLYLTGIGNASAANILYYDNVTGQVTYDVASSFSWNVVTAATTNMVASNGYIMTRGGSMTINLPATAAVGDLFEIVGYSASLWTLQCGGSQKVSLGNVSSSVGGSLASTLGSDCVRVLCVVADTEFVAFPSQGNPNLT